MDGADIGLFAEDLSIVPPRPRQLPGRIVLVAAIQGQLIQLNDLAIAINALRRARDTSTALKHHTALTQVEERWCEYVERESGYYLQLLLPPFEQLRSSLPATGRSHLHFLQVPQTANTH